MHHIALIAVLASTFIVYRTALLLLYGTQDDREPPLLETTIPFFDSAIGIFRHRVDYLVRFRRKYGASIHTLRAPFQRMYVVHNPKIIHMIQKKSNAATFIPNLVDFGMLFSGLHSTSRSTLKKAFSAHGNGFTLSVHKYLLDGTSLNAVTKASIDRLTSSMPNNFQDGRQGGLLELVRHELCLAMTGAIYGPENPYDDPAIEASWVDFVPGISHLLYSPLPWLTARRALHAQHRVISAFQKYFETQGHLQAFPMVPEMYALNLAHGLTPSEAAKMEMATSLAMLSSGAVTTFWLLFHILSDPEALGTVRDELEEITQISETKSETETTRTKSLNLRWIKDSCPTLVAMLNETLRYHSTVINIKQVQHDTVLAGHLLKKNAIIMIPGASVHHSPSIWGPSASTFNYTRFLDPEAKLKMGSTAAFRPFGAGASMCPGRHFSTNVMLGLVAAVICRFDVVPIEGVWRAPSKLKADFWNAMPKPDWDVDVRLERRGSAAVEWKFVWA